VFSVLFVYFSVYVFEHGINFLLFRTKFYYLELSLPPAGGRVGDGGFDQEGRGMQDAGCRMRDAGYRIRDAGCGGGFSRQGMAS
jgi:hypothetical protein